MYAKPFLHGVLVASSIGMYLVNKHMNSRIDQYRLMYEENIKFLEEAYQK